jgi:hypothetical protein
VQNITVFDGRFSIASGEGSGIGTGAGSTSIHFLTINNGIYTITSSKAAAIGTSETASSRVDNITIRNGTFTLHGTIGIGSQHTNGVGRLWFHRDAELDFDTPMFINCSASGDVCLDAEHMDIQDCPITAVTTSGQFLGGDIHVGMGWMGGVPRLYVQFVRVSKNENVTGCHLIHFGDVDLGGATGICKLKVNVPHNSPGRFDFDSRYRGFMVELAPAASISVDFACPDVGSSGALCWGDGNNVFPLRDGEVFFNHVYHCPGPGGAPNEDGAERDEFGADSAGPAGLGFWCAILGAVGGLVAVLTVFVVVWRRKREAAFNKFDDESSSGAITLSPNTQVTPEAAKE